MLSSIEAAETQYLSNLLWHGDITKAQLCYEAIVYLLYQLPQSQTLNGRGYVRHDLQNQLKELSDFIKTNSVVAQQKRASFTRVAYPY